jgi:MATE family multidrug resistance protein
MLTTAIIVRRVPFARWRENVHGVMDRIARRQLFVSNVDITVRTLLLTGAFALMTERGARMGVMELAANQILLQAFLLMANLLDGFATAAEVFGARAVGADSRTTLKLIVRRCALLSLAWGLTLAATLVAVGPWYLSVMTSDIPLQRVASTYWLWVAALPLVCIWAFFWDGVFMGAMRTRTLRNSMIGSVALYVPALFLCSSIWGNHGIWAALLVLMGARGGLLTLAWPALRQSIGAGHSSM